MWPSKRNWILLLVVIEKLFVFITDYPVEPTLKKNTDGTTDASQEVLDKAIPQAQAKNKKKTQSKEERLAFLSARLFYYAIMF